MQKTTFDRIFSFLHGASLAFLIVGIFITFKLFLFLGIINALFASFVFIFIALVLMLFIDSFKVNRQRLDETKKQTSILQRLEEKLNEKLPDNRS